MRNILTEQMVEKSVWCIPQLGLIYFMNPKVACTTIKYSMWVAADQRAGVVTPRIHVHGRGKGPFVKNLLQNPLFGTTEMRSMRCFSVVRNPFVRTLSAYLDKIAVDTPVSKSLVKRFGISDQKLQFIDFLRVMEDVPDELMNHHYGPQYLNLLLPFSKPFFVGRLEEMGEVWRFLAESGISLVEPKGNPKQAGRRLQDYYTEDAEAIVARKFADDFRLFGYSTKLTEVNILKEPQWRRDAPDLLMAWLSDKKYPLEHLDAAPRAYCEIQAEENGEKRISLIRAIYEQDDNWRRLGAYARIARRQKEALLSRQIRERIEALHAPYRDRIESNDILMPADA